MRETRDVREMREKRDVNGNPCSGRIYATKFPPSLEGGHRGMFILFPLGEGGIKGGLFPFGERGKGD